eukprot:7003374-Ditylum_brightwellii.AAC.1
MDIVPEISSLLTIVLLQKVDLSDLNRPECKPHVPETSVKTVYIKLPNKGPDMKSLFAFISNHYDTIATHTNFLPSSSFLGNGGVRGTIQSSCFEQVSSFGASEENIFLPAMPLLEAGFVDYKTTKHKEAQNYKNVITLKNVDNDSKYASKW